MSICMSSLLKDESTASSDMVFGAVVQNEASTFITDGTSSIPRKRYFCERTNVKNGYKKYIRSNANSAIILTRIAKILAGLETS